MVYTNLSSQNFSGGIDNILIYTASNVPVAIPLLIGFIGFLFVLGIYSSQAARGRENFSTALLIGSFISFTLALIATLANGLVNRYYLTIFMVIFIFSFVFRMFVREP